MALDGSRLNNGIQSYLIAAGFDLNGTYSRGWIVPQAVGNGVVDEINASAIVIVPTHAGGTYNVTALSQSGMQSKIYSNMSSYGIEFGNQYGLGAYLPDAVATAVTAEVLSKCTVSIPYDGSGEFQVVGLVAADLEAALKAQLIGHGIDFDNIYGRSTDMIHAIAEAVATEVNANAVVSGGFAPGGTYPVL